MYVEYVWIDRKSSPEAHFRDIIDYTAKLDEHQSCKYSFFIYTYTK